MRLDKFLKVSRLIKRRTLAKEACDRGQVTVNGRVARAGTVIKPGDMVTIDLGGRWLKVEIVAVSENVPARQAAGLYRIVEEKIIREPEVY
ncbi:RNA-binding S4 domain-containing protein [Desulfofundulus thermobenzoicus]|uniref:RQC P-site tRNA stabilizing factor n=1 Tax=Desulfofundulus thermobenzoicus TaxID=29376 RepID=A0A6N7INB9_9FIRM|nr:RNA-binding S4 domain-containing protein [Desulfofundulus thermobenzoicus]MQL51486.1 RNA-binding S4 domain-containing protein [Desulfofundulus thermobenzoicus]HHW43053.1 RNA-binding S4 domain-containing protein [Desulfotomaculum sp.]